MTGTQSHYEETKGYLRNRKNTAKASDYLPEKFGKASRFVVSSQIWLNTIPTRNCDVLVIFPKKTNDKVLIWLHEKIKERAPELQLAVRRHKNTCNYGFYFTSSFDSLLKVAEELTIQKTMLENYGGGMKEFIDSDRKLFKGIDDPSTFFTSQERQICVKHMIDNIRAQEHDELLNIKFLEGQAIVPYLLSKGILEQMLPLHRSEDLTFLRKNWMQTVFRKQPLGNICEYFGVKIAMYFAYLGHYTASLLLPTILGVALWFISGTDQLTDDYCFVIFGFANVIWATVYLEAWKRKSAEHAYSWGTLDSEDELLVEPRPLYHGYLVKSHVTGRLEPYFPAWKRNFFKYFISWPIIVSCLLVVFVVMWCIFELQDWINAKTEDGEWWSCLRFFPKILLALSIGILDDVYKKIALWLNDKENYRHEDSYENHLIVKLILFQFVNSFLSLFYIAFYLQDMDRLREQLAMLLITRQVIGNIKESILPFILSKMKLFKVGYQMTKDMSPGTIQQQAKDIIEHRLKKHVIDEKGDSVCDVPQTAVQQDAEVSRVTSDLTGVDDSALASLLELPDADVSQSAPQLTQAEVEAAMKQYEDTFEDYLEMFIQFGYVTLFSSAFPLAALCAFLNNVIEIRSDAFKLCMTFQRPFGQRVNSIGSWQDALEVMSMIAVMVNCALIGMSDLADRIFPGYTTTQRIFGIVILEHIILASKMIIAYSIPDTPLWVAEEKAKLEWMRRQALKKVERNCYSQESKGDPLINSESNFTDKTQVHNTTGNAPDCKPHVSHTTAPNPNNHNKLEHPSSSSINSDSVKTSPLYNDTRSYCRFRSKAPRSTWSKSWSSLDRERYADDTQRLKPDAEMSTTTGQKTKSKVITDS